MNVKVVGVLFVVCREGRVAGMEHVLRYTRCGSETRTMHKFVVYRKDDNLTVVMGEPLKDTDYYCRHLLKPAAKELAGMEQRGGGEVVIEVKEGGTEACFSGKSLDFGYFDPILEEEEVKQALKEALEVTTVTVVPLKTRLLSR